MTNEKKWPVALTTYTVEINSQLHAVAYLRGIGKHYNKIFTATTAPSLAGSCEEYTTESLVRKFAKETRANVFRLEDRTAAHQEHWGDLACELGRLRQNNLFTANLSLYEKQYSLAHMKGLAAPNVLLKVKVGPLARSTSEPVSRLFWWNLSVLESAGVPYIMCFPSLGADERIGTFWEQFYRRFPTSLHVQRRDAA